MECPKCKVDTFWVDQGKAIGAYWFCRTCKKEPKEHEPGKPAGVLSQHALEYAVSMWAASPMIPPPRTGVSSTGFPAYAYPPTTPTPAAAFVPVRGGGYGAMVNYLCHLGYYNPRWEPLARVWFLDPHSSPKFSGPGVCIDLLRNFGISAFSPATTFVTMLEPELNKMYSFFGMPPETKASVYATAHGWQKIPFKTP